MPEQKLIDATTAAERLGIRRATLYSYVSRGLIRTRVLSGKRERQYFVADVEALRKKRELRRPSRAVARALDFGLPVLETSITSIEHGKLRYRGIDAMDLAASASFESVAKLLWGLPADAATPSFNFIPPAKSQWARAHLRHTGSSATDRALLLLPCLLQEDDSIVRRGSTSEIGAGLVGAVAAAAAGCAAIRGASLSEVLARIWRNPAAADAIRCALVLCADHELNASTFAVRVVASTGAKLTAAVIAGLAALSGPRHGGMTLRVESLLEQIATPARARSVISERLTRGEGVPGFDHQLYPEGDPRAKALLTYCADDLLVRATCKAASSVGDLFPTVDIALVGVERAFRLPRGSSLALFAIGRSVGWVAHAIEQRQSAQLIRPRAKFTA